MLVFRGAPGKRDTYCGGASAIFVDSEIDLIGGPYQVKPLECRETLNKTEAYTGWTNYRLPTVVNLECIVVRCIKSARLTWGQT